MHFNFLYKKNIAAFIAGCFFLCGCENKPEEVFQSKKTTPDEAKTVTIRYTSGSQLKALLTSPLMYRSQLGDEYVEFPNTVHVDFFDALGKQESKLDALYAKYRDRENKVFLRDSVRVINVNGDTLHCNELYWDRNRKGAEFYTDKPVRIRTKTHIIDGIGMDASQDFKEWHIVQSTGFVKVAAAEFPE